VQKEHDGIGKIEILSPEFSPSGNYAPISTNDSKKDSLNEVVNNYHGIMLVKGHYDVLMTLEQQIGHEIPLVSKVEWNTFGFVAHDQYVTALGLYNKGLSALPESLGNLTSLTTLDLRSNQLNSLPESLGNLTSPTTLDLRSNQLSTLPESLGNLTSLTTLYLQSNQLNSLPENFFKLTNLQKLSLGANKFSSLPESLGNLKSLTTLRLSYNKLSSLPECCVNLISLTNEPIRKLKKGVFVCITWS
jgi:Leucine-rich repeat (LRR) protein